MTVRCHPVRLLVVLSLAATAYSQSGLDLSLPDLRKLQLGSPASGRAPAGVSGIPMDAPLDPAEYIVGPGDVVAVNVWSASPLEYQLTVTPEGYLLIPNVGAVNVRDLTLQAARDTVIPRVQRWHRGAEVSLTLLSPRRISVQIAGQVMNEGMIEMSSAHRIDHLVAAANTLPPTQTTRDYYFYDVPRLRRDASERNISVRRRDGTLRRVDLVKYSLTGKSSYNPYLREGDMVYVPLKKPRDINIGVLGGFVRPINVEFAEGDSLTDLVALGHGLKATADTQAAILARSDPAGGMDTLRLDLKALLAGKGGNRAVEPGDRLFVPETPDPRAGEYVTIEGEVIRPGRYPVSSNSTTLRQLIDACGGFTAEANPVAATLIREESSPVNVPEEMMREQLMSTRTALEPADSGYYLTETALRLRGEMVSVNFRKVFVDGDASADVTLRNFDRLTIPPKQRTVYVFGQVLQPGHVPYVAGEGVGYYVDRASGYTSDARTGDVRVIKAGSRIWLDPGETEVEDGDFIWVPKDIDYPFSYYLTTVAQISGILGTVATLIILATTLK